MSDYTCEHGHHAMGRYCPKCCARRETARITKKSARDQLKAWMDAHPEHVVTALFKESNYE